MLIGFKLRLQLLLFCTEVFSHEARCDTRNNRTLKIRVKLETGDVKIRTKMMRNYLHIQNAAMPQRANLKLVLNVIPTKDPAVTNVDSRKQALHVVPLRMNATFPNFAPVMPHDAPPMSTRKVVGNFRNTNLL